MQNLIKQYKTRPVILVRHAETIANEEDLARGWSDWPLEEDTTAELHAVGKALKSQGVYGIVASDLLRTLQTAKCLAIGGGLPILKIGSFLHTWNIGKYTGKPTDKVDPILEELAADDPFKTIEGGESFEAFKFRYLLGLIATLNEYPGKLLALSTHGRNLATLNAWAQMGYNDELEISSDHLGYEDYPPATAHLFNVKSNLLF